MLTYKASCKTAEGVILAEVLDFPGVIAYGNSMDETRRNLASALRDMAETNLLAGEALPLAKPNATDLDADLEEPIQVL